jgi:putative membrane protein
MRVFYLLILLILLLVLAVFALQNSAPVSVQYLDRIVTAPMSLLITVVYLLGMLSGWTVVGLLKRSVQRVTERPRN